MFTTLKITKDKEEIKITDFGTGRPPSFLYMAPEIFSKQPYNVSSDIYSLGLIIFYLVVGCPPFDGFQGAEAAAKAAKLNIRPALPQSISPAWKALISSCWNKNPVLRPTASQVLESLKKFENDSSSNAAVDQDPSGDIQILPLIDPPDSSMFFF